jgi:hypothetical protein
VKDLANFESKYLKVLKYSYREKRSWGNRHIWRCLCLQCGSEFEMEGGNLQRAEIKGCGCQRKWTKDRFKRFIHALPLTQTGCKEWPKYCRPNGYGYTHFEGRSWGAHRLSYYLFKGIIPVKLLVCHKCDNRKCINPDHLFIGNGQANMNDCFKKGRTQTGEKNKNSILLSEDVKNIRKEIRNSTYRELALKYKVSYACIWDCINRSWKHLT